MAAVWSAGCQSGVRAGVVAAAANGVSRLSRPKGSRSHPYLRPDLYLTSAEGVRPGRSPDAGRAYHLSTERTAMPGSRINGVAPAHTRTRPSVGALRARVE